jgi:hypothetical protein
MTNLDNNTNTRRKTSAQRDNFRENANKDHPAKLITGSREITDNTLPIGSHRRATVSQSNIQIPATTSQNRTPLPGQDTSHDQEKTCYQNAYHLDLYLYRNHISYYSRTKTKQMDPNIAATTNVISKLHNPYTE